MIDPASERLIGSIQLGDEADVDRAVAAARAAFPAYAQTTREQRIALLESVLAAYQRPELRGRPRIHTSITRRSKIACK